MEFSVNDPVFHTRTWQQGMVTQVNSFYGWFVVKWDDGTEKRYTSYPGSKKTVMLDRSRVVKEDRDRSADSSLTSSINYSKPHPF